MAWALVVAVAVVGLWVWRRRAVVPRIVEQPAAPTAQGGSLPITRISGERSVDVQILMEAFRSDDLGVSADAERHDQELLVRLLQFLAEMTDAQEAVLWEATEGAGEYLVASAWSRGQEPPALPEQDRMLIQLAASEQGVTFNPSGPFLRLMATGVPVNTGRGAVSVHFAQAPSVDRSTLESRLRTLADEVATRHELLRTRGTLARRTKKLRSLVKTAITLQGTREPEQHEQIVLRDALLVTSADWGVLVRGNREGGASAIARVSADAPGTLREGLSAMQHTLVGDVFATGVPRTYTDTRPLFDAGTPLFDGTPLPSGTRSLLLVPIRRDERERCLGVLVLGRGAGTPFNPVDSGSAGDLGYIAAGALDTAWAWQEATQTAKTDQLTGLPNRRAFEEEFARMISETDRYGNESALVIVDVDHFKKVNDTYGHDAGDQVLKQVGATLLAMKRTTDKVARLGGEELAILLPQTDREGALEATERCRKAIEALAVRTGVGTVRVTASFGVAMYSTRSGAAGALFDRADQALYAAKHGGRNRVVLAPD